MNFKKYSRLFHSLPTDFFQKSLPRLPIPSLERSLAKYLRATKPLISPEAYETTCKICSEFQNTTGKDLHRQLVDRDAKNLNSSFIDQFWLNSYLKSRSSLPLNFNPCIGFLPKQTNPPKYQNLITATNIITTSLAFKKYLENNTLYPEVFSTKKSPPSDMLTYKYAMKMTPSSYRTYASYLFSAYPLDMSQYDKLFGTSRIPGIGIDKLVTYKNSSHILVIFNGHFYSIDVFDNSTNEPYPESSIFSALKMIYDDPQSQKINEHSPGHFTTLPRNLWASAHSHFLPKNKEVLKAVDSALFCLCLDLNEESDDKTILSKCLAGNAHNRWFDKSLSIIVDNNCIAAVNFEHSWGDGVAVLRFINEIVTKVKNGTNSFNDSAFNLMPEKLEFNFDLESISKVEEAKTLHDTKLDSLNIEIVRENKVNKNLLKQLKLSPDAVIQILLQVAYRRAFGNNVATYESCSTSAFKYGRTETMRPTTDAAIEIAKLMFKRSNLENKSELRDLFTKASDMHSSLIKEAATGKGFDRHLFALQCIAEESNFNELPFFQDENYKFMNNYVLSGSTLSGSSITFGGFGPVVEEGYAFGYKMSNTMFESNIIGYNSSKLTNLSGAFEESWTDFLEMIT